MSGAAQVLRKEAKHATTQGGPISHSTIHISRDIDCANIRLCALAAGNSLVVNNLWVSFEPPIICRKPAKLFTGWSFPALILQRIPELETGLKPGLL